MFSEDVLKTDNRRLTLVALVFTFAFAVVTAQLIRYQVLRHTELQAMSDRQTIREQPLQANRGSIVDAHGQVLAMDVVEWDISVSPNLIKKAKVEPLADSLSRLLDMNRADVEAALTAEGQYRPLKRNVPEDVREAVVALGEPGVKCDPRFVRVYPAGALVSQITGLVLDSRDGFYGVEGYYDRELKPVLGRQQFAQDPQGNPLPLPPLLEIPAMQGTSLILTLDLNIQHIAEQELARALKTYDAQSGTVLIMDPRTGAILASVSLPTYEPAKLAETEDRLLQDPSVSSQWEPGSIFKVITWAIGLDTGTITPNTQFQDRGALEVGGRVIANSDHVAHGLVTMQESLLHSLNTAAAFVSTSVGKEAFYTYVRRFGFGSKTDVDLAGEIEGTLRLPGASNWFPSDLGVNSFGQGIAVTSLQMISAVAAVANKGTLMRPHIVQEFVTPDEQGTGRHLVRVPPQARLQAISEQTARTLTDMLVQVTESSSSRARVPGYRIAGKTGTAQIPTAAGYDPSETIQSFIGYAPADDPQFIVLVKLDRPESAAWAADSAAPTFGAIAARLFLYLQIPPDDVRLAQRPGQP